MGIDMKEKKEKCYVTGKENTCTMMGATILETGSKEKWKDRENLLMLMAIWSMKVSGKTITMKARED